MAGGKIYTINSKKDNGFRSSPTMKINFVLKLSMFCAYKIVEKYKPIELEI